MRNQKTSKYFCRYIFNDDATKQDTWRKCGKPAINNVEGDYYCDEHLLALLPDKKPNRAMRRAAKGNK